MTTSVETRFENRIRFNWGYHDASFAVRRGLTAENNYGFAATLKVSCPEDLLTEHYDETYARGWMFGYYEAIGGGTCVTSKYAWATAFEKGDVHE